MRYFVFFFLYLKVFLSPAQIHDGTMPCEEPGFLSTVTRLKELKTLDDLPPGIKSKVVSYLKKKHGSDFYKLLTFERGTFYKSEDLGKVYPEYKDDGTYSPVYELYFALRVPGSGIDFWCSRITFDASGNVSSGTNFPEKRKEVPLATFVSLEKIKATADARGYKTDTYELLAGNEGHIVLKFRGLKEKKYSVNIPFVEISVHTGEYISGIGPMEHFTR